MTFYELIENMTKEEMALFLSGMLSDSSLPESDIEKDMLSAVR